jgi:hypothetical protein
MRLGPAFFSPSSVGGLPTVTLNPSDKHADITLSAGNLVAQKTTANALRSVRATRGIVHTDSGYFEMYGVEIQSSTFILVGVSTSSLAMTDFVGSDANSWGYYQDDGSKYTNNTSSAYGASYPLNTTVIGVAFKNGKLWFAKNNTWQNSGNPAADTGAAFTGITGTLFPTFSLYLGSSVFPHQIGARFNPATCLYTPPAGFNYWGG